MHKKLLLISSCFFFTVATFSQVHYGVVGGLNFGKLSGDIEANGKYQRIPGLNIGAMIDIDLSDNITLSLQPSYSQEGTTVGKRKNGNFVYKDSLDINLNYASLPVLLKIKSNNDRFYAIGGLESSKLVSSNMQTVNGPQTPIDVQVAEWNFSLHFGAGIKFPIGITTLFLEARYAQGINNLTDDPFVNDLIPRVKTSNIKLLTGISIPFKTK